ncbi:MAG: hypothetical protein OES39_10760, partial [Desulfobulbaceae bacterium]|nr:hypothetical protein [Desulfobulbaceae bacterium]
PATEIICPQQELADNSKKSIKLQKWHNPMEIFNTLADIKEPFADSFVTIGNFDGVHLGHHMLFSEVVSRAYQKQGTSVVVTFEPHPLQVIRPEIGIKLISTYEQKVEMISLAGLDVLVVIPFTRDFAATSAEAFVDEVLVRTIGVKELVVGYDYAFGKGRQGNIEFLKEQGRLKGFPVTVVEPYYVDDMLVSSSKIREMVREGRMMDVKKLLGRSYQIRVRSRKARKEAVLLSALKPPICIYPRKTSVLNMECMLPRLSMTANVTAGF